jgi:glycine receptor alpha-4
VYREAREVSCPIFETSKSFPNEKTRAPRPSALLASAGAVRYAKLGMPFLLAFAVLVCWIVPARCATNTTMTRPNAGAGPTPVHVYLYVIDVFDVSGSDQDFNADVALIAEWRDPNLAGRWTAIQSAKMEDVWEPRLQLVNQRGAISLLPQQVEIHPDGLVRYRQRWMGRFTARMDLKDFPLDKQRFYVRVVSLGYSRDEVELIPDLKGKRSGRAGQLSITDWRLGPARMEMADFDSAPGEKALAGVQLVWEGKRQVGYYTVQIILPLVMIVLMGWTALWIAPSVVPGRMSVAITTMLTLIAYRFALGRLLPNLPYLTRFDYFTLGSTILIFFLLLLVATTASLVARNKMALAERIDRWARIAFPVTFGAVFLLIWWM